MRTRFGPHFSPQGRGTFNILCKFTILNRTNRSPFSAPPLPWNPYVFQHGIYSQKGKGDQQDWRSGYSFQSSFLSCFRLTYFRGDALAYAPAPRWTPFDWAEMGSSSHLYFTRYRACGIRCVLSHSHRLSHCLLAQVTGKPRYGCPGD